MCIQEQFQKQPKLVWKYTTKHNNEYKNLTYESNLDKQKSWPTPRHETTKKLLTT